MKTIKYTGESNSYSCSFSHIYTISCIDYIVKTKSFKSVETNEIYSSEEDALRAIIESSNRIRCNIDESGLHKDGFCDMLLDDGRDGYKLIYLYKGSYRVRYYKIICNTFSDSEIEKYNRYR